MGEFREFSIRNSEISEENSSDSIWGPWHFEHANVIDNISNHVLLYSVMILGQFVGPINKRTERIPKFTSK